MGAQSMLTTDPPLASAPDMDIPRCVANADEAIAIVREHRTAWLRRTSPEASRA